MNIGLVETLRDSTPRATLIVVHTGAPISRDERRAQLTRSVYTVIEELNASAAKGDTRTVVDIRIDPELNEVSGPNVEAYVEAIRGLVQSLTLETQPTAPAVNIVVSTIEEHDARARTIDYLLSADGGFSRGTTYDLREAR